MKKFISIFLTLSILLSFTSCQKDDLSWMQEIESIKAELANQKKLIEALQANANIIGIETNDNSYTIKFSNGQSITLTNGKTPLVTIGENGNWYINGEDTGNPSRGSDGVTPSIEIVDGHWWINGKNTGIKAECLDSPTILSVTYSGNNLIFTFSDGSTISCSLATETIPTEYPGKEILLFNKILCIGDSMTAGTFNTYPGYYTNGDFSYPAYLQKMTCANITNWGMGGADTKQWYDYYYNVNSSSHQCAIIQLGINDYHHKLTPEITTEYLERIIEKIKAENKGIIIFVATIMKLSSNQDGYSVISNTIREFVSNREDCILLDMEKYSHTNDDESYHSGHLTALGYHRLAEDYFSYISYVIHTDPEKFKYIQFIGTEY